jgi:hypothetical protein
LTFGAHEIVNVVKVVVIQDLASNHFFQRSNK